MIEQLLFVVGTHWIFKKCCHEEKVPLKMSAEAPSLFNRWVQQRWGIGLHLTHSCYFCDANYHHQRSSTSPFTTCGLMYMIALYREMYLNRGFFEGCYSKNWRSERECVNPPSAGERGSVMYTYRWVWVWAGGINNSNIVLCCTVSLCHQKMICWPPSRCKGKQTHLNGCMCLIYLIQTVCLF